MRNRENYPINWNYEIRPDILKRDKFKCVRCKAKHGITYVFNKNGSRFIIPKAELKEWKGFGDKAYTVWLQIAHLDRNPKNNDYSNLSALCPKCHLNYDREINQLMRKSKRK